MQGSTCAYCNRGTNALDVEHFRPKGDLLDDPTHGGYWWLAYEAANYVLGCTLCNQKRKSNRFPLDVGAVRVTYANAGALPSEKRILLDPVADQVEDWFDIDWSDPTAELKPHPGLSPPEKARAQEVFDLFGLNLDPEVREQRSLAYEEAIRAAKDGRWDELTGKAMRHRPHSFVARYVLTQLNATLPNKNVERTHRVAAIWKQLHEQAVQIRKLKERGGKPAPQDLRTLKSLAWALIVLRDDPVIGGGAAVNAQLEALMKTVPNAADGKQILQIFRRLTKEIKH
jgi:uncharacterized protein (TIGR02646 family)